MLSRRRLLQIATKWPRIRPGWPIGVPALAIELAHVNQWFHAISDSTRLGILEFLSQRERCVRELQELMDAPQSTVSYHLKVLRESGLVSARRDGRWKFFALRPDTLAHMTTLARVIGPGPLDVSRKLDMLSP